MTGLLKNLFPGIPGLAKRDRRKYHTGQMHCPVCGKVELLERKRRSGWQRIIPFLQVYKCGEKGKRFVVFLGISRYGLCYHKACKVKY